jgi:molybdopterin-guanine dinucleotide biosynthesis protein A
MQLDAIILAGGDPARDADLLAHAGGAPCKALIRLGDKTFLELVASALLDSGRVRQLVIAGLPPRHQLSLGPQVAYAPDAGGMWENGESGLACLRASRETSERILVSSGDIPLITPAIVDQIVDQYLSYDVEFCYGIVLQEVMERAFPGSGRTFVPIEGRRVAGSDIHLVRPSVLDADRAKLDEIAGARKTFWKQARAVGLGTLFLFLIRRLSFARVERREHRVLGFTGKVVICPHPEAAMDVDKPHHLDVVRAAWARRQAQSLSRDSRSAPISGEPSSLGDRNHLPGAQVYPSGREG